jgi:zinc transport system permease protein
MKVVGIMLISALLIFPAVTALQIAKSFRTLMIAASFSAVISVVAGVIVSLHFDLPTGATIVIINFIFFISGLAYKRIIKV